MLYHYTSLDALKSILGDAKTDKGLCFWATRFDYFGDTDEYLLGIDTIGRLLPRLEERLLPDCRIASSFVWEEIAGNESLPFPYVVSFSSRCDNEHMWNKYACNGKGVVMEVDDSQKIVNEYTEGIVSKKCLYLGELNDDELYKEIEDEFFAGSFGLLAGPLKNSVLGLLATDPRFFVALVGRYLLSYVAPRIKGKRFYQEEETRVIIAPPRAEMQKYVGPSREILKAMSIDPDKYEQKMMSEKVRKRANGDTVYYQDLYLPGSVLRRVYVKDIALVGEVKETLSSAGFENVDVVVG